MDLSVKPGDNFYLYANGNWLKNTPIPAKETRWGSFNILTEESAQSLKSLLEDASKNAGKNDLMKRVGDFYARSLLKKANRIFSFRVSGTIPAVLPILILRTVGPGLPAKAGARSATNPPENLQKN